MNDTPSDRSPAGPTRYRIRWTVWSVLAALIGGAPALAQRGGSPVSFTVQPSVLRLGESAALDFSVQGARAPSPPVLPPLPDFQVQSTPSKSSQTQIINGRVSSSVSYRYRILPKRAGTFAIGPIEYRLDGKTHNLPAVTVRVLPRDTGNGGSAQSLSDLVFSRLALSKPNAFVQESVTLVISVYSRADVQLGRDFSLNNLPKSGVTLDDFRELGSERTEIDGQIFSVRKFYSTCRGLTAGDFEFAPTLSVPVAVPRRSPSSRRSLIDQMFSTMETQTVPVDPEPVTLTVMPLPETNRPDSFSGAVGTFAFSAKASPREVEAGNPVTLTMHIEGRGNLDAVSAPQPDLGDTFKLYEPRLVDKQTTRSGGSKTFEQVVIPRDDAVTEVPRLAFSYFDPDAAAYRTVEQGPFRIVVNPSSQAATRIVDTGPAPDQTRILEVLEEDIAYLKTDPGDWIAADTTRLYRRQATLGLQILPPLIALSLFAVSRRRDALARDHARSRRRRAPKRAREGIRRAGSALDHGDYAAFHEAVWDALGDYFGDRLNLAPGEISGDEVARRFSGGGLSEADLTTLRDVFAACEQARFGFGRTGETMTDPERAAADTLLQSLETVLEVCEEVRL